MSAYTITEAVDGGYILCRNGYEVGLAADAEQAGQLAARDAIDGYPEIAPDFMHDVALDRGLGLADAVRQDWFEAALSEEIMAGWPQAAASPAP